MISLHRFMHVACSLSAVAANVDVQLHTTGAAFIDLAVILAPPLAAALAVVRGGTLSSAASAHRVSIPTTLVCLCLNDFINGIAGDFTMLLINLNEHPDLSCFAESWVSPCTYTLQYVVT